MISKQQHDRLLSAPNDKAVHTRSQAGKTFTYMAQHAVRAELIQTFGFDGWTGEVVETDLIESKQIDEKKWMAIWRVRYRLTVRWQSEYPTTSTWVEDAVASAFGSSQPDTLDQALKSAASDAMKRCAMNLGSRFGLGLYFDGFRGDVIKQTIQGEREGTDSGAVAAALAGNQPSEGEGTGEGVSPDSEATESLERDLNTPEGVAREIENLKKGAKK